MKRIIISISVIIAAMVTFASCVKNEDITLVQTKTITFTAHSIETKTTFDAPVTSGGVTKYPTLWTAGDKVDVFCNYATNKTCSLTVSDDCKSASFVAEITPAEAESYKFYSVAPASAANYPNAEYTSVTVEIPTLQTPSLESVDPEAQILAAVSNEYTSIPDAVSFTYEHITAYGRMSLSNLPSDVTISSVRLQFSQNVSGSWYYYPDHYGAFEEMDITWKEKTAQSTIDIITSTATDIWFACVPVDFTTAGTMTVTVSTDKGTYVRDVNLTGKKFEAGKVAKFTVNMTGIKPIQSKTYTLVQNDADLTIGSEIIIVAKDYDYAMGASAGNYMNQADVVKSEDNTISNISSLVMKLTLAEGNKENTIALVTPDGKYLYAASSSSNYLKTGELLSDEGSWILSIMNGITTVMAQGENSRNTIFFNSSDDRFSCYASTSTTQKPIQIYKAYADDETPTPPVETVQTPTIVFNNNEYTITCLTEGAVIWYAVDEGEFEQYDNKSHAITEDCTVKAYATKSGCVTSETVSKFCDYQSASEDGGVIVLNETFDDFTGTGGNDGKWSGSIAGGSVLEHNDWGLVKAYKGNGCLKLGTGSEQGSATTPAFGKSGNMTMTFRAGAWDASSEKTTLILSIENGGTLSATSVEMTKGVWTDYTITIEGATVETTVTFIGYQKSYSRFFLDDVKIVAN